MQSMLDLQMNTISGCAVVRVIGAVDGDADANTIAEAMRFVPIDDHLVVDLRQVERISPTAVHALTTALVHRLMAAETVVVSDRADVTLHLVLADADRLAPLVATVEQALQVIRSRSGADLSTVAADLIDPLGEVA